MSDEPERLRALIARLTRAAETSLNVYTSYAARFNDLNRADAALRAAIAAAKEVGRA